MICVRRLQMCGMSCGMCGARAAGRFAGAADSWDFAIRFCTVLRSDASGRTEERVANPNARGACRSVAAGDLRLVPSRIIHAHQLIFHPPPVSPRSFPSMLLSPLTEPTSPRTAITHVTLAMTLACSVWYRGQSAPWPAPRSRLAAPFARQLRNLPQSPRPRSCPQ